MNYLFKTMGHFQSLSRLLFLILKKDREDLFAPDDTSLSDITRPAAVYVETGR